MNCFFFECYNKFISSFNYIPRGICLEDASQIYKILTISIISSFLFVLKNSKKLSKIFDVGISIRILSKIFLYISKIYLYALLLCDM